MYAAVVPTSAATIERRRSAGGEAGRDGRPRRSRRAVRGGGREAGRGGERDGAAQVEARLAGVGARVRVRRRGCVQCAGGDEGKLIAAATRLAIRGLSHVKLWDRQGPRRHKEV